MPINRISSKSSLTEGISVQYDFLRGFTVDEIKKRSSDYIAILMSTMNEGGILENIFGSVSSAIRKGLFHKSKMREMVMYLDD